MICNSRAREWATHVEVLLASTVLPTSFLITGDGALRRLVSMLLSPFVARGGEDVLEEEEEEEISSPSSLITSLRCSSSSRRRSLSILFSVMRASMAAKWPTICKTHNEDRMRYCAVGKRLNHFNPLLTAILLA